MCSGERLGLLEGLGTRRSTRAFQSSPISSQLLNSVFEVASYAPSAINEQPWEVYAVSGEKLQTLREKMLSALKEGKTVPMQNTPSPERYEARRKNLFNDMKTLAEKNNMDTTSSVADSIGLFGAPACAFIFLHKDMASRAMDIGSYYASLCLSAHGHGLGSCIIGFTKLVEPVIREYLDVPEDLNFTVAVALGYPDTDSPRNEFTSSREPISQTVRMID